MSNLRNGLLLILLWVFPHVGVAAENCAVGMGTVCMEAVQQGNSVSLSAINRETYEVTITVKADLKNMTSSVRLPYSRTLEGRFRQAIMTFLANPQGSWEWKYQFSWMPGSLNAHNDASVIYDLPFRGTRPVMQGFHGAFSHTGDFEYAVDFQMPIGTPVFAAREGVVEGTRADMNQGGPTRDLQDKANFILIRHPDGTIGTYDHLRQGGVAVKVGDQVGRRQLIGYSGNTGFTSGPHLHFMIFKAVDGYKRESFPMRFRTANGIISPVQGQSYTSAF